MIKINLIAVEKLRPKKAWAPKINLGGQKLTVGCAAILIATLTVIGWRYWKLGNDAAQLEQDLTVAQQETQRLHSVIGDVQKFEQRRGQLQQRVGLIEQLRKNQTGPVHALDQVSRSMPPMLWLTDLKQIPNSNEVVIDGRCAGLTRLSDFVASLEASGYFKRSVEIVSTQLEGSAGALSATGDLIKFSIKAQFEQPGSGPAAASTQSAADASAAAKPAL
jgi:type IV pilus assembly protein PilN